MNNMQFLTSVHIYVEYQNGREIFLCGISPPTSKCEPISNDVTCQRCLAVQAEINHCRKLRSCPQVPTE